MTIGLVLFLNKNGIFRTKKTAPIRTKYRSVGDKQVYHIGSFYKKKCQGFEKHFIPIKKNFFGTSIIFGATTIGKESICQMAMGQKVTLYIQSLMELP
jgi:hypothetical protein